MKERIKEKAVALENILSGMDRTRSAGEYLVQHCINSRVNSTRYPRPLHACEASRRLHYAVASQTHR